jgi:hypothetical protein
MRSVWGSGGVLALSAPALLVALLGVGCGGHQASSQELPKSPEPVATIAGDGLLPGDRKAPDPTPTVTTAAPRPPIGRTKSPVPARTSPTPTGTQTGAATRE